MLVIVAAGDRSVYEDCSSCFQAMGKTSFFIGTTTFHLWRVGCVWDCCWILPCDINFVLSNEAGEAGNAARMMLILNMVQGSFMATIAEGLTLAQATGQSQQTFLDILCQGQMASTFVDQKCQSRFTCKCVKDSTKHKWLQWSLLLICMLVIFDSSSEL